MNQLAWFSYDSTFMRVKTCEPMKAFPLPSFVSLMNVCMIKLSLQTNSLVVFCVLLAVLRHNNETDTLEDMNSQVFPFHKNDLG